jgi:hypothetical protein
LINICHGVVFQSRKAFTLCCLLESIPAKWNRFRLFLSSPRAGWGLERRDRGRARETISERILRGERNERFENRLRSPKSAVC